MLVQSWMTGAPTLFTVLKSTDSKPGLTMRFVLRSAAYVAAGARRPPAARIAASFLRISVTFMDRSPGERIVVDSASAQQASVIQRLLLGGLLAAPWKRCPTGLASSFLIHI